MNRIRSCELGYSITLYSLSRLPPLKRKRPGSGSSIYSLLLSPLEVILDLKYGVDQLQPILSLGYDVGGQKKPQYT